MLKGLKISNEGAGVLASIATTAVTMTFLLLPLGELAAQDESVEKVSCGLQLVFEAASVPRTDSASSEERSRRKACLLVQLEVSKALRQRLICENGSEIGSRYSLGKSMEFVRSLYPLSQLDVESSNDSVITRCSIELTQEKADSLYDSYVAFITGR